MKNQRIEKPHVLGMSVGECYDWIRAYGGDHTKLVPDWADPYVTPMTDEEREQNEDELNDYWHDAVTDLYCELTGTEPIDFVFEETD